MTTFASTTYQLPRDWSGSELTLQVLGFTVEGVGDDYQPTSIPSGWELRRQSERVQHIVDPYNRVRVHVWRTSQPYMQLVTLREYLEACRETGAEIRTDPRWATPQAVRDTARVLIERSDDRIDAFVRTHQPRCVDAELRQRDHWSAVAAHFDTNRSAA